MSRGTYVPYIKAAMTNNIIQVMSVYCIAKENGKDFKVDPRCRAPHLPSNVNYFKGILSGFEQGTVPINRVFHENPRQLQGLEAERDDNVLFDGYWQNYTYLEKYGKEVFSKLRFNVSEQVLDKYDLDNSVALHVRLGDYIGHPTHDVIRPVYYQRSLAIMDEKFGKDGYNLLIFSNGTPEQIQEYMGDSWERRDTPSGITQEDGSKRKYYLSREDEETDLYLMLNCAKGIISANSSYSWFASYFNQDRTVILPSIWYNHDVPDCPLWGYHFPSAILVEPR